MAGSKLNLLYCSSTHHDTLLSPSKSTNIPPSLMWCGMGIELFIGTRRAYLYHLASSSTHLLSTALREDLGPWSSCSRHYWVLKVMLVINACHHNVYDLMSVTTMSCPEDSISQLCSYILCFPSLWMVLSLRKGDVDASSKAEHSTALILSTWMSQKNLCIHWHHSLQKEAPLAKRGQSYWCWWTPKRNKRVQRITCHGLVWVYLHSEYWQCPKSIIPGGIHSWEK